MKTRHARQAAPLGSHSVDDFMRRHWQRKPLLIRQALPGFVAPLAPDALVELAGDEAVESRLITRKRGRWGLEHGPFDAEDLPTLDQRNWTLLVQGVDLHSDAVQALLARFRFVPDARLDDLMISLAGDGGGVGPHVDSYDVFLLQAWGRRRWRIGPVRQVQLVPGLPLRILDGFEPDQEWVLEPGDMLYLPPGWGHDGVADGPCMTCSIGFRAPSRHEFLAAWLAEAADTPGGPDPRFRDPARRPDAHPARLPHDLHQTLAGWARDWRPDPRQLDRFIGRFLSEPKASVWFDAPPPIAPAELARRVRREGIRLDRRSKMLWRNKTVFINGEACDVDSVSRKTLRKLADFRLLEDFYFQSPTAETSSLFQIIHEWYEAGWLQLGSGSATQHPGLQSSFPAPRRGGSKQGKRP